MKLNEPLQPTQAIFDWTLARAVAGPDLEHGRLVLLTWSAPTQGERVVQWYIDGEWAGCSSSSTQRAAWLTLNPSVPRQIELLAVAHQDALTPMPNYLAGTDPSTAPFASFAVLRDVSLPIDTRVCVVVDDESTEAIALFDRETSRGGFGAVFGEGGFGYDASTGPGLGRGALGEGPLGIDGQALRWQHSNLETGEHVIRVSAKDRVDGPVTESLTLHQTTQRLPEAPRQVAIGNDLQLSWT